ncbi:MAG: hypothetical protein HY674_23245 [Chloroflexi bacterium]|nr:hypothetical protein [Chloroflexota bacterium]
MTYDLSQNLVAKDSSLRASGQCIRHLHDAAGKLIRSPFDLFAVHAGECFIPLTVCKSQIAHH